MNRLRELRRCYHISQAELAAVMAVAQNTVSNWETGMRVIDADTLGKLADFFHASTDYILGRVTETGNELSEAIPLGNQSLLPILGEVCAGFRGYAQQEILGYEPSELPGSRKLPHAGDWKNTRQAREEALQEFFFLRVTGDSMEPEIKAGDLALIHKQADVESGQLAVVLVGGETGTVKKVIKTEKTLVLQAFNPNYPPKIFEAEELEEVQIMGRVIEVKRKF